MCAADNQKTLDIPVGGRLLYRLECEAVRRGISVDQLAETIITERLKRGGLETVKKPPAPVFCITKARKSREG